MTIGIVVPTLTNGDAVSNDALGMAAALRSTGNDVEFFVLRNTSDEPARGMNELPHRIQNRNDVLIYHHQIGFEAGVRAWEQSHCNTRIVKYHNITPPELMSDASAELIRACHEGFKQVPRLLNCGAQLWADSAFNAEHLQSFKPTCLVHELPPFHQVDALLEAEPDYRSAVGFDDWCENILVVGRVAPNKNLVLALETFADYRMRFNKQARLIFAGDTELSAYHDSLVYRAQELQLGGSVYFTGKITLGQLKSLYLLADALLCTSLHEGFCVPLIEAMALRVPIVAVPVTAIPGTAGEAARYAEDAARLADALRDGIAHPQEWIARGHQRYESRFRTSAIRKQFLKLFQEAIGGSIATSE